MQRTTKDIFENIISRLIFGEPEKQIPPPSLIHGAPPAIAECGGFTFEIQCGPLASASYLVICYRRSERVAVMTAKATLWTGRNDDKLGFDLESDFVNDRTMERIVQVFEENGLKWYGNPVKRLAKAFQEKLLDNPLFEEHFVKSRFYDYTVTYVMSDVMKVEVGREGEDRIIFKFFHADGRLFGYFSAAWTADQFIVRDQPYLCNLDTMIRFVEGFGNWKVESVVTVSE